MLIAVTGFKRNGKDSIADILVNEFGYKKDQFARPMKEACSIIFGWSLDHIENHKEEVDPKWGISPRQVLTVVGTEFGQYMLCDAFPAFKDITGRRLWARRLMEVHKEDKNKLVISDLRFPHEEEEIRVNGGIVIKVYRPGFPADMGHESERCVFLVQEDYKIENDGTLDDLKQKVLALPIDYTC